jgi:hypothetical protein
MTYSQALSLIDWALVIAVVVLVVSVTWQNRTTRPDGFE